jgi:hypothetical protein
MKPLGYFFWLVLLLAGSVLWLTPRPWAVVMGRYIVFTAAFVGVTAPRWLTGPLRWPPRAVAGLLLANLLPMFVVASSFSQAPSSTPLRVLYVVVAVAVVITNSYVTFWHRRAGAG